MIVCVLESLLAGVGISLSWSWNDGMLLGLEFRWGWNVTGVGMSNCYHLGVLERNAMGSHQDLSVSTDIKAKFLKNC